MEPPIAVFVEPIEKQGRACIDEEMELEPPMAVFVEPIEKQGRACIDDEKLWELMELVTYSIYAEEELKVQQQTGYPNSSYRSLLIVGATVAALLFLSNVLLLLGVHKNRASLLLPWLLVYSVLTCLSLIVIWLTVYAIFTHTDFLEAVGMLALSLFKAALVLYCILVVHSFYCSLKEKTAAEQQPPPPTCTRPLQPQPPTLNVS